MVVRGFLDSNRKGCARLRGPTMDKERFLNLFVKHQFGELYSANLKHAALRLRFFSIPAGVILVLLGSILIIAHLRRSIETDWSNLAENLEPLFLLMVAFFVLIPVLALIGTQRTLRDPRTKNGFTYDVSNHGIRCEGSAGRFDMNWTAFTRAREVSDAFLLYVTRDNFHLFPKRCFAPGEIDLFREIIRANLAGAKLQPVVSKS